MNMMTTAIIMKLEGWECGQLFGKVTCDTRSQIYLTIEDFMFVERWHNEFANHFILVAVSVSSISYPIIRQSLVSLIMKYYVIPTLKTISSKHEFSSKYAQLLDVINKYHHLVL
jgi:hypothetical protein